MHQHSPRITHTIHLVRHAQCIGNVVRKSIPVEENLLTTLGKKQADALGDHLKEIHFTKVFSSPHIRSYETVNRILAKSLQPCVKPLIMDPDIRERESIESVDFSLSEFQALVIERKFKGLPECELEIPGCENQKDFVARIRTFFIKLFDLLKESEKPEAILIVSHCSTLQRFLYGLAEHGSFSDLASAPDFKLIQNELDETMQHTSDTILSFTLSENGAMPTVKFIQVYNAVHLKEIE